MTTRTKHLHIRITEQEHDAFKSCADMLGLSLSDWIRTAARVYEIECVRLVTARGATSDSLTSSETEVTPPDIGRY